MYSTIYAVISKVLKTKIRGIPLAGGPLLYRVTKVLGHTDYVDIKMRVVSSI